MSRVGALLTVVGVAALGLATGVWSARSGAPAADARLDALTDAVEEVRERLDRQDAARGRLEAEIWELRALLTALGEPEAAPAAPPPSAGRAGAAEPDATEPGPAQRVAGRRPAPGRTDGDLDAEALVAAGFAPAEVERFEERLDGLALARLELRDRATREGWSGTDRFREEQRGLADERRKLRDDFGDDLYDWSLYTSGRNNRVRVDDVMLGGSGEQAGLRSGDVILRYADEKILGVRDLRQATTGGRSGETTPVDVVRGGETIRVYVPRGPLGVRVQGVSRRPDEAE